MSLLDEQMAEVADFFVGRIVGDTDVIAADELDRTRLDFSLESLKVVDAWLARLREYGVDPNTEEAAETIIWTGAYIGEVIRRNAKKDHRWQRYEEYMTGQREELRNLFPYTFGTQFVLASGPSSMRELAMVSLLMPPRFLMRPLLNGGTLGGRYGEWLSHTRFGLHLGFAMGRRCPLASAPSVAGGPITTSEVSTPGMRSGPGCLLQIPFRAAALHASTAYLLGVGSACARKASHRSDKHVLASQV